MVGPVVILRVVHTYPDFENEDHVRIIERPKGDGS
jgi:hypothetical protein